MQDDLAWVDVRRHVEHDTDGDLNTRVDSSPSWKSWRASVLDLSESQEVSRSSRGQRLLQPQSQMEPERIAEVGELSGW